jgi:Na+/H+ antiporter NhaB
MKSLTVVFYLLISVLPVHDIHISLTELEIDTSEGVAQLSVHIFLDDLEAVLSDSIDLQLFTPTEAGAADVLVMSYLREHIYLSGLADSLGWQLIGRELSDDMQAAYFYLESAIAPLDAYDFGQTVLFDLFDDQQSICDIRIDGRKQHVLLHAGQPSVKLER